MLDFDWMIDTLKEAIEDEEWELVREVIAYLKADDLERDVYVRPPKGAESDPDTFRKAIKPLYG